MTTENVGMDGMSVAPIDEENIADLGEIKEDLKRKIRDLDLERRRGIDLSRSEMS